MRKVTTGSSTVTIASVLSSVRYARTRGRSKHESSLMGKAVPPTTNNVPVFTPTSIPPTLGRPGMLPVFTAADTPSISSLRSQIEAMRNEKKFAAAVKREASQERKSFGNTVNDAVVPVAAPPYNFTSGLMADGVKAHEYLVQRRASNDLRDVIRRPASLTDIKRLCSCAGIGVLPSERRERTMQAAKELTEQLNTALVRYVARPEDVANVSSSDPAYTAAMLDVVHDATDAQLAVWIRCGLVDPASWDQPLNASAAVEDDDTGSPLATLAKVDHSSAFVSTFTQSMRFGDVPPPDVAPAMLKADRGDYGSISATELRSLEQYETKGHQIQGKVFAPSSPLLAEIAKHDERLKASMDVMERVKRSSLMDTSFQKTLDYVNSLHEARFASMERLRPTTRTSAAEVPYFFGSKQSQPPPSADMNLPEPRASREEAGRVRRSLRLRKLRRRFGQR